MYIRIEGMALYILITALLIIIICENLNFRPYKRIKSYLAGSWPLNSSELYICKDLECKYGQRYCCMSCGQRRECEVVCEDYEGPCEWRVKHGED